MKLRLMSSLLATMAIAVAGIAQDASAAQKAIEARYAQYVKAIKAKDLKGVMALSAGNRTYKTKEGQTVQRADIERSIAAQFKVVKSYDELKFAIKNFKLNGKEASMIVSSTTKAKIALPNGDKTAVLASKTESRVWWTNTDKGWLILKSEVIDDSQTLDGKPIIVAAPKKGGG